MKMGTWVLLALAGFIPISQARSQSAVGTETGNDFYAGCRGAPKTLECLAYVQGVVGGAEAMAIATGRRLICVPPGVTSGQLQDVIVTSLRNNPADNHLLIAALAFIALETAFPCKHQHSNSK